MDNKEIEEKLKEIAAATCDELSEIEIDSEMDLTKQGMDSLDVLDYVLAVEAKFGIKIDNDEFDEESLGQIKNLVAFLASKGE